MKKEGISLSTASYSLSLDLCLRCDSTEKPHLLHPNICASTHPQHTQAYHCCRTHSFREWLLLLREAKQQSPTL